MLPNICMNMVSDSSKINMLFGGENHGSYEYKFCRVAVDGYIVIEKLAST